MVNPVTTGLKEGRSPQDERPTPDPDLFYGGERVRNPADLSMKELITVRHSFDRCRQME